MLFLRVIADLHATVSAGSPALLVRLDMSSAFDTIEHSILLKRLEIDFGVTGVALSWIRSFVTKWT